MGLVLSTISSQRTGDDTVARRLGQDVLDLQAVDVAQAFLRGIALGQ